jgi:RNA polymerase sigma-70 factor, ECF subfamily
VPETVSFDGFYGATRRRMVAYAYALTGDPVEAQDAAQEAYARAWEHWRTVSGHEDREAWVRKVVWRIASNRWRHVAAGARAAVRLGPPRQVPDESSGDRVSLVAALQKIPDSQRRAIVLRYLYDLTVAEVAEETGAPVGTVKSRLARGLEALAPMLSDGLMTEGDPAPARQSRRDDRGPRHHRAWGGDHV